MLKITTLALWIFSHKFRFLKVSLHFRDFSCSKYCQDIDYFCSNCLYEFKILQFNGAPHLWNLSVT
jgi:hypothetical protein